MAGLNDKLGIKLEIGNETIGVNVPRDKEQAYRVAGKLINQKINTYKALYPQKEYQTILAMTLIDIALAYELNEDKNSTAPYLQSIEKLTKEIEETLNK